MSDSRYAKQVIVVRKDLNMRKGKIGAQVAHASLGVILNAMDRGFGTDSTEGWMLRFHRYSDLGQWLTGAFTKVCVSVNSEAELLALEAKAKQLGLMNCLITDNGKTEFNGVPTVTCLAVGPGWADEVDQVTGGLPLL